ncbi:MAG: immunity 26/phosphotriesterase HocA family protein [Clostridia bacterium]|nr:immunity 26/phosphotriesterase HocA family protein [Clostridia bacterium]
MFELSNEQRKCFALKPICAHWDRIEAKPSPYDSFKTFLYLDGNTIVKCIVSSDSQYFEYELSEKVSSDQKFLLPKTAKGKPVLLSSSSISKRRGIGMRLNYINKTVHLCNENTECSYFMNTYQNDVPDLDGFSHWVEQWCDETSPSDQESIIAFSQQKRIHVSYREGDVFRFKIGRRLYGYGRILLDYDKMRKHKEPFWDILMTKPLVCSVYHIVTDRKDISVNELIVLNSLPSTIIMDDALFYGEYEIVGNIPVKDDEDYPIMYGNSISMGEKAVCYQCGKTFLKIDNAAELYPNFRNNSVSPNFNFTLDILLQCVKEGSNSPYWANYYTHSTEEDLRNPKFIDKLNRVKDQFGL